MPTIVRRLNQRRLEALAKKMKAEPRDRFVCDGDGLYLKSSRSGVASWVFYYRFGDRRRKMGLGPLRDVSVEEARAQAAAARKLIREGIDPLTQRASSHGGQDVSGSGSRLSRQADRGQESCKDC